MFETIIQPLVEHYGYLAVFVIIALESAGLPLPGEAVLIAASAYAGAFGGLNIVGVIIAAAGAAIFGDNIGYWIGRRFGLPLLVRYGHYVHLTPARLKLGQYLFLQHGAKIVFFGRFVAVLRVFAAVLAGANRYEWKPFLFFNAAGAIVWATIMGAAAHMFGDFAREASGTLGIILLAVAVAWAVGIMLLLRRHEAKFQAKADLAFANESFQPLNQTPPARH
jgi:membrane protein DedA with SNARE-associated domain